MNVEQQIRAVLAADATVAALVAARIHPLRLPQTVTMPAINYQRVATAPNNDLEGDQTHEWVRVQVDCWAATYAESKTLAAAVRVALRTTPVYGQLLIELDDYDNEEKLYRVIQDFNIWN